MAFKQEIQTLQIGKESKMKKNGMLYSDQYIYTPATTDVTIRWRKLHGWVPPTEDPAFQKKWADFRAMTAQGIESIGRNNMIRQATW